MSILVGEPSAIGKRTAEPVWDVETALKQTSKRALRAVCDTITSAQLEALFAHAARTGADVELTRLEKLGVKAERNDELPRPAFDEDLVPMNEKNDQPSLAWYTTLLRHALHAHRPARCCILWGPPGVGKTLALERISEMLRRQRAQTGAVEGARLLNTNRACRVPELGYFSCAAIEDEDDVTPFIQSVAAFANTAAPNSILVLDDIDAVLDEKSVIERLLAIMATGAQCRRVMVANDYYERVIASVRKSEHFFDLYVGRAHMASLAAYLQRKVPTLKDQDAVAYAIAQQSGGDVRAALISACFDCAMLRGGVQTDELVGVSFDMQHRNEPLHTTLLHCARSAHPSVECEKLFYDGDWESAAQVLYANHPRMLTAQPRTDTALLEQMAEIADTLSVGNLYEQHVHSSGHEGKNAEELDKKLLVSLTLGNPIALVGRALQHTAKRHAVQPFLEFPLSKLYGVQHKHAAMAQHLVVRSELQTQLGEVADSDSTKTVVTEDDRVLEWCSRLLLLVHPLREARLVVELESAVQKKFDAAEHPELARALARCTAAGVDAENFARLCMLHFTLSGTEHTLSETSLRTVYTRTMTVVPVVERGPKKPKKQMTLFDMVSRLGAKKAVVTTGRN